ncbi:MAG: hypothetical protein ACFFG0_38625 [Candidatus Thorarchaeota archaeon]
MDIYSESGDISGQIKVSIVRAETTPSNVISTNEEFSLKVNLQIPRVPLFEKIARLRAHFCMETIGVGDDYNFTTEEKNWEAEKENYEFEVFISKGTLREGVYKLSVAITTSDQANRSLPFHGFAEHEMLLQVYEPF